MKTNVSLPKFLKKSLSLYSIIVVVFGITVVALINFPSVTKKTEAQTSFAGTCSCSEGNLGCGICSYSSVPQEFINHCQSLANDSGRTHIAMCWTENTLTCEELESSVCYQQYPDGSWAYDKCNNPMYNPPSPPPPPPPPPPPSEKCYYHDNAIRTAYRWNDTGGWQDLSNDQSNPLLVESGSLYLGGIAGDNRYVGSHLEDETDNGMINITGPNGFSQSDACDSGDCTLSPINISSLAAGVYTVSLRINEPYDYDDPDCDDIGYFRVLEEPEGNFDVRKVVTNPRQYYRPGDHVKFNVEITNTGETTLDYMRFVDYWNPHHMRLANYNLIARRQRCNASTDNCNTNNRVTLRRGHHYRLVDINANRRQIVVDDLTEYLGDLRAGENYYEKFVISFDFVARAVRRTTCNVAIGDDGEDHRMARKCVPIRYSPPTPTDR